MSFAHAYACMLSVWFNREIYITLVLYIRVIAVPPVSYSHEPAASCGIGASVIKEFGVAAAVV